ncbi:threonine ammonia-lyase IlvA [Nonlabens xiamenensis]|uniref:threonine ammonia-lyase IlvA n=1 Tax=Nonlabens xiamenensis TaxID=2341043 RepID=UPI000F615C01|nr:threonine ammonia-lyase IlvA [Nonlabens xiamenensis]
MNDKRLAYYPKLEDIRKAALRLKDVACRTPLELNAWYSDQWDCSVYFKREDLQPVRSYKIRGAYNKISSLSKEQLDKGVVCASAGNHAQGVAMSCKLLQCKGVIYMPTPTPVQKIEQVRMFGGSYITILMQGDTYDDAYAAAMEKNKKAGMTFIHPFDDEQVIEGQATVGLEIIDQAKVPVDYVIMPVGGGGLSAGVSSVLKYLSPTTKIIGVEPKGAPSMGTSLFNEVNTTLTHIDSFVDGAAVKRVGDRNFGICQQNLSQVIAVTEGAICQTILDLYNSQAIVVEPAGAMSITALAELKQEITGKNVVCVISGSNNDITRTAEIKERALLESRLKHYFIIRFPQRAGALREFVEKVLGPNDDITHFEYTKKTNRINGSAVVGIELKDTADFDALVERMKALNFYGDYLNDNPTLFEFLV